MRQYVVIAVLYAAASAAIIAADFGPGDDVIATVAVIGVQFAFGVAIGRWWAVALPWLAVIPAPLAHDPDYGPGTEVLIAALAYAPSAAIVIALSVALRKWANRRRHRGEPGLSAGPPNDGDPARGIDAQRPSA